MKRNKEGKQTILQDAIRIIFGKTKKLSMRADIGLIRELKRYTKWNLSCYQLDNNWSALRKKKGKLFDAASSSSKHQPLEMLRWSIQFDLGGAQVESRVNTCGGTD
jgi:hypothetical protein